jgi:hypothetical protein
MQEQAPAPRKPITAAEILRPEILLGISGLLTLIAGAGAELFTVIIIALIMIYSAVVSLGYIDILRDAFPVLSVSTICGGILFLWGLEWLVKSSPRDWPYVVMLVAGLVALFAAYVAYAKPAFARRA